ncbi:MAG: DUF2953 domain-containing protein [Hyphomicrobiales bacterium]|jgi:hypothetical protein
MVMNLLGVLGGLLIAALLVLCLPVRFLAHAQTEPHMSLSVRVSLLDGLIPAFPVFDSGESSREKKKAEKKNKAEKKATKRKQSSTKPKQKFAWARATPALINDLRQEVIVERFHACAVFGLADPADTGALFGQLSPWMYGLTGWTHVRLDLRPNFEHACLDGQVDAAVKVTPIRLLPPLVRFGRNLLIAKGSNDDSSTPIHNDGRGS